MITVSAFKWVPPFAQGLVRDLRVRWALEEAGLSYREKLIDGGDQKSAAYRALQPFGQVPMLDFDGLVLFESGAIVLHVGRNGENLLPPDESGRARATTWVIAALNSVEPPIMELAEIDLFHAGEAWTVERRPVVVDYIHQRLGMLADWLGDREFLEGRFTAGDLIMVSVLRNLRHTDIVAAHPALAAYVARGEARPAFQKALADQLATFAAHEPPARTPGEAA